MISNIEAFTQGLFSLATDADSGVRRQVVAGLVNLLPIRPDLLMPQLGQIIEYMLAMHQVGGAASLSGLVGHGLAAAVVGSLHRVSGHRNAIHASGRGRSVPPTYEDPPPPRRSRRPSLPTLGSHCATRKHPTPGLH